LVVLIADGSWTGIFFAAVDFTATKVFPLQCALDKSANLVIARAPVYRSVALEDPARIGVNYEDFVITGVEQDCVCGLRSNSLE
jgi:hypothetical protein